MPSIHKLTIASVSSEAAPFVRTGGLADVAGTLPQALKKLGHHPLMIMPLYFHSTITECGLTSVNPSIHIPIAKAPPFAVWMTESHMGVPIYFIDNETYFKRTHHIYDAKLDNRSFYYLNHAALALLKSLNIAPHAIHCHDWHAGLIPYLLKRHQAEYPEFAHTATVFTIHNLSFQMSSPWYEVPQDKHDDGRRKLPAIDADEVRFINFAKRGIIWADSISTVSEQYAEEILSKDFGEDLQQILRNRKERLFGIVNGIDYQTYNPMTDPGLYQNYDMTSLHLKKHNKLRFQKEVGLPQTTNPPMIALTSRLSEQKGFDLLMEIIDPLLRLNVQLVILGEGEQRYQIFFERLRKKNPKKVSTQFHFDPIRETQILAAADMLLMPSRFEPCGIGQLKSLRYGCIPIVHSVGGLAETITDYSPVIDRGNGFTFDTYDSRDLLVAITRAITNYRHRNTWLRLQERAMRQSFSWDVPAIKYVKLFRRTMRYHEMNNH